MTTNPDVGNDSDELRCQFCEKSTPASNWTDGGYTCPSCGRMYDALLAQDEDDG